MKDYLKGVSPELKADFLEKLQSGKYELLPFREPKKETLNFDLIPESGLFKCKETGEVMSKKDIDSLEGYGLCISVISDRQQVSGEKPPHRIILNPLLQHEYLNSLLKLKC